MSHVDGHRLLVANRGEVAVRVLRAAAQLGLPSCAVATEDETGERHARLADDVERLPGRGARAYLDVDAVLVAAERAGCTLLHPGWGFLSEVPALARACERRDVVFVGPRAGVLELLGDKVATRRLAAEQGVELARGTDGPTSRAEARAFVERLDGAPVVVKAVAGGGGRGMRVVRHPAELDAAYDECRAEAAAAFGQDDVYVEQLLDEARHVEVQVAADDVVGAVSLGDRDCSVQRRHQKLLEIAPAPGLPAPLRARLADDAVRVADAAGLTGLATVEFLVDATLGDGPGAHRLLEVNPRLQVEHTVTEAVLGLDLVAVQLRLALGARLDELGLDPPPAAAGHAVQARLGAERLEADGTVVPTTGTVSAFTAPGGPGVRTDTHLEAGTVVSGRYDSLLAKVVAHVPSGELVDALRRLAGALRELHVAGVETNRGLLVALAEDERLRAGELSTRLLTDRRAELVAAADRVAPARPPEPVGPAAPATRGAQVPPDASGVYPPTAGQVVSVEVDVGDVVGPATPLLMLEAMKMQHAVTAGVAGRVVALGASVGDDVTPQTAVAAVREEAGAGAVEEVDDDLDLDAVRDDLAEVAHRKWLLTDEARAEAVAKRHGRGLRTARENLDELVDPGTFVEYGSLAIAAQRRRRDEQELLERTQADGLIGGIGRVNGDLFADDRAQTVVMSYDYMVLAGTQGTMGHRKKDRLFLLTERLARPVVFFTEGGGGRPGDTDATGVAGLDTEAFHLWARLSGVVPRIGIASGRCFAGNAVLFGGCDLTVATPEATIGMGGPAMIEGGGLGRVTPEEVGPTAMQARNGVIDVLADDEADAVRAAKRALAFFQGSVADWECADQRRLRHLVPEDRLRVHDVHRVIDTLADTGSVLELRPAFAPGMVTALARVEGRPVGIVANNATHLAGAITSDGADKAARFLQLCEAFDLPIVFLCDTPGIMVGPDAERTGLVRHAARLFLAGGALTVPFVTIVLRKGYGLGAQAMAGGSFRAPLATVSWPTGEFGGMGLEGAVQLSLRRELEAIDDPGERQRVYDAAVAAAYERGKALSMASVFELDDVIDPADSRHVIVQVLRSAPDPPPRHGRKAGYVDAW